MNNKKSLFAVVALVLVLLIGATIAYFQSSASFDNIFNTGTYKVVTTEVFESPDNWKPGEEIPKTITTRNEGTIDAAVRVSFTEKWEDSEGNDITLSIPSDAVTINLDNQDDWTKQGNYYYYNYPLKPNKETTSFIKSVTLNAQLGSGDDVECTPTADGKSVTCEATDPLYGAKYTLTLTKETVQYDKYSTIWTNTPEIKFVDVVYSQYEMGPNGDGVITSFEEGLLDPPSLDPYLKYILQDGEIVGKGIPCINFNSYGEYCIESDDYEENVNSLKGFVNFDENTWTKDNDDKYTSSDNVTCYFNSSVSYCSNSGQNIYLDVEPDQNHIERYAVACSSYRGCYYTK